MKTTWKTDMRLIKEYNNYNLKQDIKIIISEYFDIRLEGNDLKERNIIFEDEERNVVVKFEYKSNEQSLFDWKCILKFKPEARLLTYECISTKTIRGRADKLQKSEGQKVSGEKTSENGKYNSLIGQIKNEIITAENQMW